MDRDRTDERRVRNNEMTTDDIDLQPIRQGAATSMSAGRPEFSVGQVGPRRRAVSVRLAASHALYDFRLDEALPDCLIG